MGAETANREAHSEASVVDVFSNLPKDVADEILSLLSFKDLTQVGFVSKRCRGFSLSTPCLNFHEFSDSDISTCEKRKRVLDCLDRFLIQRGHNLMQCFRFCWSNHLVDDGDEYDDLSPCYCDDKNLRLRAWIDNAVSCNVEVVHLVISSPVWLPNLPASLFLSGSLRSLFVDMKCMICDLPSMGFLSNLESIKLKNVFIQEEGFWKWISNCCKCIKELHLEDVSGLKNVTFESSSLESFSFVLLDVFSDYCGSLNISGDKIEKIHINWVGGRTEKLFNLSAPNLKCLTWIGRFDFESHQNLGKFMFLERAEISSTVVVNNLDALVSFLYTIRRVKVLILNAEIVKAFSREGFMPLQLGGVRCLGIKIISLTDDLVPAVATLLRGLPNLISLHINSNPIQCTLTECNCSGYNMEYWKVQDIALISQIKEVVIKGYHGSNVAEFVRYLLEHAQNLEKMTIFHYPDQRDSVVKLNREIISNATVSFHEFRKYRDAAWFSNLIE